MNDTCVYNGKLDNDIKYSIHQASSFSGRSEIALFIEGDMVAVWGIEKKVSGNIECRPVLKNMKMVNTASRKKNNDEAEQITQTKIDDL